MPAEVPIWGSAGLKMYGCTEPQQPLYAIPEILGSCLPVEWKLSGAISLWGSKKNDSVIFFKCNESITCDEGALITLTDRCGTKYIVKGLSCCESAETLSVQYTSLVMSCGGSQTLYSSGGCSLPGYPMQWSLVGGGSLDTSTGDAIYTAPATNPSCSLNPTITVTDCCGNSANVTLSVNCYTYNDWAFQVCTQFNTTCDIEIPGSSILCGGVRFDKYDYRCDGTLVYHMSAVCQAFICPAPAGCPSCYQCYAYGVCYTTPPTFPEVFDCGFAGYVQPCNTARDLRTDAMKAAGCCPINPYTGLPF